jgi:hypothetical protein
MLPFAASERGLSSTWRFIGVGVEMVGADGGATGGVAVRGGDVAGFVVGRDWVWGSGGSAAGVGSSFFLLFGRFFERETMFVSECIGISDGGDDDGEIVRRAFIWYERLVMHVCRSIWLDVAFKSCDWQYVPCGTTVVDWGKS